MVEFIGCGKGAKGDDHFCSFIGEKLLVKSDELRMFVGPCCRDIKDAGVRDFEGVKSSGVAVELLCEVGDELRHFFFGKGVVVGFEGGHDDRG